MAKSYFKESFSLRKYHPRRKIMRVIDCSADELTAMDICSSAIYVFQ